MAAQHRRCDFSVTSISPPGGKIVLLTVTGDLGMISTSVADAAISSAFAMRPTHLVIDVGGLLFCGARGMSCLARADRAAQAQDISYSVTGLSIVLERSWPLLVDEPLPRRRPTAADAVTDAMRAIRRQRHRPPHPRDESSEPARREPVVVSGSRVAPAEPVNGHATARPGSDRLLPDA